MLPSSGGLASSNLVGRAIKYAEYTLLNPGRNEEGGGRNRIQSLLVLYMSIGLGQEGLTPESKWLKVASPEKRYWNGFFLFVAPGPL